MRRYNRGPRQFVSDQRTTADSRAALFAWINVWLGLVLVTLVAIYQLRDFPAHLSWLAAFENAHAVLGATAWAAVKVWSFWAWSAMVLGAFVLKLDPGLDLMDAALIGAAGLWVVAYLLGNLLGPPGLFNGPAVWLMLGIGSAWVWRSPPQAKLRAPTSGEKLTALAVGMLGVSMLPLQLASPVPPFMDVLNIPASAQQLLTFHIYLPFADNPYGVFGVYNRAPALELFYAMLALGSHTPLAVLAETAAMLPMAALLMFATWRLGKSLLGDTAGGAAALLLFFTCILLRTQGMRPTAVGLAMVGLGLAFFCDPERRRTLMAVGAIFLGTSVPSHAILGAFAMAVAGVAVIMWAVERDWPRVLAGSVSLIGALLISITEVLVGLERPVAYPVLPMLIIAGTAVIAMGAALMKARATPPLTVASRAFNASLIAIFLLAAAYRHVTHPGLLFDQIAHNLPMLTWFCAAGLVALAVLVWSDEAAVPRHAGLVAAALLVALGWDYVLPIMDAMGLQANGANMVSDVGWKLLDYWTPYFMVLPAGYAFAVAYERWSRPVTLFALLAILIYPWHISPNPADFESVEHSVVEHWAFNLDDAAQGYWAGHADRRWTFGPAEIQAIGVLNREVAAGRITARTHILHLADSVSSWGLFQFSIVTGINDDPIVNDPGAKREGWLAGSRVSRMPELAQELAMRPPYIIEQVPPPAWLAQPPQGYEEIFNQANLRIFRRRDLNDASPDGKS